MIICLCEGVSRKALKKAIKDGANTSERLKAELRVALSCGQCLPEIEAMLKDNEGLFVTGDCVREQVKPKSLRRSYGQKRRQKRDNCPS